MNSRKIKINNCVIHYVEKGPLQANKELAKTLIFLHGFPEYWGTWQAQLDYFSADYRVIAPDLPGYNLSDKPAEQAFYSLPNLIQFFAQFIATLAPQQKVLLVAHDWGGAIAWPLAAFYPDLFERLVIINAAHPSTFTREMIHNPEQRQKSAYIHELIAADAETRLSQNNFEYLQQKLFASMAKNRLTESQRLNYLTLWSKPGAMNGMLQYYRAMPQLAGSAQQQTESSGPVIALSEMKVPNIRIQVKTLVLWGEQDQAFVLQNLDNLEDYVTDLSVKRFPDATHWLHHEQPELVNSRIQQFFSASS